MSKMSDKPTEQRAPRIGRLVLWTVMVAVVLAAVIVAALPDRIEVDVASARRTSLEVLVREDGRTRVRDRFALLAPVSGELLRVEVDPGSRVVDGEIVARLVPAMSPLLDPRSRAEASSRVAGAEAIAAQARSGVTRARATLDMAIEETARQRRLLELASGTPYALRQAELAETARREELASAEFQIRVTEHQLESARASLRQLESGSLADVVTLRAPLAGDVLRVLRRDAGPVAAGTPLLEIGDPARQEVVVDVLTADAVRVHPGCPVRLFGWGGDSALVAHVRSVEPSAFTRLSALGVEEQRVNVVIDLEQPLPASMGDGYRVDAEIVVWSHGDALTIPVSALFRWESGWAVFAVEAGRARRRVVIPGEWGVDAVQILEGLEEAEVVIIYPSDAVTDGARLRVR